MKYYYAFLFVALQAVLSIKAQDAQAVIYELGTVGGKTFYQANTTFVSWSRAATFCQEQGLRLGMIKSQAQQDLLKSQFSNPGFAGYFWMGAADSRDLSQFSWQDGSSLEDYGQNLYFGAQNTCLNYYSTSSMKNGEWNAISCNMELNVLCESF